MPEWSFYKILMVVFVFSILLTKAQRGHLKKFRVTQKESCQNDTFLLVFEDNFDGTSLDESKWIFTLPWGTHSSGGTDYSLEYFTNGLNHKFDNGAMSLIAKDQKFFGPAIPYRDSSYLLKDGLPNLRWWDYTSGMIYSKKAFGYGKYELRCKIPKGKGFWSAFMLYGEENHEIDVFEFWNEQNIFRRYSKKRLATECHMTTHVGNQMCATHCTEEDFSKDFHTYTLIWNNNKIEWYIDGALRRTSYKYYTRRRRPIDCALLKENTRYLVDATFPSNKLHISVGLSLQPGKNAPDASTPFPSALEIDYIRYWSY